MGVDNRSLHGDSKAQVGWLGLRIINAWHCSMYRRRLPWGNGGNCSRRKTPHRASPCEDWTQLYFSLFLRKINKKCSHQSCPFKLQ